MALDPKEIISLELEANPKKAILEITRFQRHVSSKMKQAQESTQKMDKGFSRFMKQVKDARTRSTGIKQLADQFRTLDKVVKSKSPVIAEMVKAARSAKRGSQARKDIMARIAGVKKSETYTQAFSARRGAVRGGKELQETSGLDWKDLRDGAEEAGESLSEPLRDLLSKDAPTLMRRMARTLMGAHSGSMRVRDFGTRLSERGSKMMAGGGPMGKVAGGAAKAGGELTKMLGGLAEVITKIGPILSVAGSFMMSFIKIMIDAESAAKDFNRQILSTTGTSRYLNRSMGDVSAATESLNASLRAARDGAMDWSATSWGISKETAVAFQSAITAEGVALDRLGNATADATENAKAHTRSIQMGVAYSRAFGVSLSEIANFQGQLMADLGMGAKTVQTSYQTIADGAHEAGMETNKFFGIIRTFSSDLSLFVLRLAEVSKIMGVLGKTMDPRKMAQFLQTLQGKFQGGMLDNLKFEMLAGPKGKEIARQDMADKLSTLSADLKDALGPEKDAEVGELISLLKDPNRDSWKIAQWQAKHQDRLNGTLNETIQENANLQTKLASGDKLDQASVMDALGPLSKMETLEAASRRLTGRGFERLSGLSLAAVEATGIASAKEVQMFQRLKQGIMQGQAELIDRTRDNKLRPDDYKQLSKLGVAATGTQGAKELERIFRDQGGDRSFMKSLEKTQQELLTDSSKEIDYQADTAGFQTSTMDRLGIIADILLNKIYGVMTDIWGSVVEIVGLMKFGRDRGAEFSRAQLAANKGRDLELSKIFSDAGGDLTKAKTKAIEDVSGRAQARVMAAIKEHGEIKARLATGKDDAVTRASMENRLTELAPALGMKNLAGMQTKFFKNYLYRVGKSEEAGGVPEVIAQLSKMLQVGGPGGVGVPGAASAPGTPAAPAIAVKETGKETAAQQQATTDSVRELNRTIGADGVKLDPATVSGVLTDAMSKSVYEGSAKALFEYYMYSGLNRTNVSAAIGAGISPAALAHSMNSGVAPDAALGGLMAAAAPPPNAMGGTVTGIMGNMAKVTRFPAAPAGEGWASVGRGEKILPAGAGGGSVKVELELKGDLKRFIQARVVEGAASHDRNKRLR